MTNLEIKISVDINDERQMQALSNLLSSMKSDNKPENLTNELTNQKVDKKQVTKATIKQEENTEQEKHEQKGEPLEPNTKKEENVSLKIEDIRALVSEKVGLFREEIKKKLTEFGANNVTSLEESKYPDFMNFLKSLK